MTSKAPDPVDVPAQERVAKLARGIVAVDQPAKIAESRVRVVGIATLSSITVGR